MKAYVVQDLSLKVYALFSNVEEAVKYAETLDKGLNKAYYEWESRDEFDYPPFYNEVAVVEYTVYNTVEEIEVK